MCMAARSWSRRENDAPTRNAFHVCFTAPRERSRRLTYPTVRTIVSPPAMNPRALRLALPLALVFVLGLRAQNALPSTNPFAGPPGAATPDAPQETIEFAGVSTMGQKVDLIFQDKATKKTTWVPLGGKADGIEVVNYDAKKEQVVARINGAQKTLTLRKSTAANASGAGLPAPVAPMPTGFNVPSPAAVPPAAVSAAATGAPGTAPATPPAPATPMTETQKQEQEARMLVSDLLEIGMAQRKAYEEAQRKAQEGGPAAPVTSPSASALPAPGTVIPATSTTNTSAPTSGTSAPGK